MGVLCGAAAFAVAGGFGSVAHAATIVTTSADAATLGPDGTGQDGDTLASTATGVAGTTIATARAGSNASTTNMAGKAYVIPFTLPTLAAGSQFTNVSLGVVQTFTTGAQAIPTTFNADLYGLTGYSTTSTAVTGAMYYQGALDTTNATLLQAAFLTPAADAADTLSTPDTAATSSAAGNTALAAYLNAEYAANGAGSVVFLRLNANADSGTGTSAYVFDTFDTSAAVAPTITFSTTAVPEPTTLGLAGVAAIGLVQRSRRSRVPAVR